MLAHFKSQTTTELLGQCFKMGSGIYDVRATGLARLTVLTSHAIGEAEKPNSCSNCPLGHTLAVKLKTLPYLLLAMRRRGRVKETIMKLLLE